MADSYSVVVLGTLLGAGIAGAPATYAAIVARKVHHSVQPNGETLAELLHHLVALTEYQHTRNHDILNELSKLNMAVPLLIEKLES